MSYIADIPMLALQHVAIAAPAIIASLLISVPLARIALLNPVGGYLLLQGSSLLFAIPALPLLVAIPSALGISRTSPFTLIVLLTLYGVAVMARSVSAAFAAIDDDIITSADAMGYSPMSRFMRVEVPVAWPAITRSLRLVCASTLSMTVAAIVGVPGLGLLITRGYAAGDIGEVACGVVATLALALVCDALIARVASATSAWERAA